MLKNRIKEFKNLNEKLNFSFNNASVALKELGEILDKLINKKHENKKRRSRSRTKRN